ncbi:6-phosphogluconolactonase [Lachnospiraceae bacterium TWA4]|nr:6-phosphogluconolactonase [Lachnospiraceae bacterium TWA4]
MAKKCYAYVGSYTYIGKSKGLTIFEVDVESGKFTRKKEIECNNASYMTISHSGKFLYSIVDEGVIAFKIEKDGDLTEINKESIKGMRGCHILVSPDDKYLFVGSYHDGKATVLRLNDDGSIDHITDGVFHKGLGGIAEKSHRPHVNCVRLTPDYKYLCAVDTGIDQIKLYSFSQSLGTITLSDILRCQLDSGPKKILFSDDGRFMYLISEITNKLSVYTYDGSGSLPKFECIQTVSTVPEGRSSLTNSITLKLARDNRYIYISNAGDNSISMFKRDAETGLVTFMSALPIAGDYPKDLAVFPDDKHLCSVNHETGEITFFTIDREKGLLIMNQKPEKVDEPNCCQFVCIDDEE